MERKYIKQSMQKADTDKKGVFMAGQIRM